MSRSVESTAWNNYLLKFSQGDMKNIPLGNISYGDQIFLSLDPEWKMKFQQGTGSLNEKNESIPSLIGVKSQILSDYFSEMTSVMNEKAKIHRETALKISSKLKAIIQSSLQHSEYEFIDFQLFGSTVNCLALESSSDLDFALIVQSNNLDLKKLFDHISSSLISGGFTITEYVLKARVPIMCLKDSDSDLEV
jgi:hypothetical protein